MFDRERNLPAIRDEGNWKTLSEAARLLGVHPTTLRRWADDGQVRCMRTPGGHRRFLVRDLESFLLSREQSSLPHLPEAMMESVLTGTRREILAEGVSAEPWHSAFDDAGRAVRRESGRRLLGLALQYTLRTTGRDDILEEAQRIGWEYGYDAAQRGLSLSETARAFFFFRETLTRATRPGLLHHGRFDAEDIHIHRSLREFNDCVFIAALEGYEQSCGLVASDDVPQASVGNDRFGS